MSLLKKILGQDAATLLRNARNKEEKGDWVGALVDYEKALERLDEKETERRRQTEEKISSLGDRIAQKFIAEAQDLIQSGELERAVETLGVALERCGTEQMRQRVRHLIDSVSLKIAEEQVVPGTPAMSDDEIYQALSGSWSQAQIDEFDGYGEEFKKAYLQFHSGSVAVALEAYRRILERAGEDALYLRFEIARALHFLAQSRAEKNPNDETLPTLRSEAIAAIEEFLRILPKRKTPEVRAQAWNLLAQMHIDMKNFEDAEDALVQAQNLLPAEPAVYLNLGRFLFEQGRLDDAIYALEQGEKVMDKFHPNLDLLNLLGTAYRRAGKREGAMARLETIIAYFVSVGRVQFDPTVALPLAEMMEETGKLVEACDLYRNISLGGDDENLAVYNYHCARLMKKLGRKEEEIRPFIMRAREHAANEALRRDIEVLEKG